MKYTLIIDKNADEEVIATVHAPSTLTRQIEDLVISYTGAEGILGHHEDETRRLCFGEIECITIIGRKVIAIDVAGKQYWVKERLRDLETIMPSYFIRINKSTLANEHSISHFCAVLSGGVDAVFRCGYREYVSRRCLGEIKRRYEGL